MAPTNIHTLSRRYASYNCTDYYYMRECSPHRIIIGAIVGFVIFIVVLIIALLCVRHRKHKMRNAQAQAQRRHAHAQKQAVLSMYEAEPELQAPPPAYARVDPEVGVRRGV